jgi:hypothetical protein
MREGVPVSERKSMVNLFAPMEDLLSVKAIAIFGQYSALALEAVDLRQP